MKIRSLVSLSTIKTEKKLLRYRLHDNVLISTTPTILDKLIEGQQRGSLGSMSNVLTVLLVRTSMIVKGNIIDPSNSCTRTITVVGEIVKD